MNEATRRQSLAALTLGAIGVVYGDIGTSPLYALKEVFANGHVPLTPGNIYGVLSLVFWTLTVVVARRSFTMGASSASEMGMVELLRALLVVATSILTEPSGPIRGVTLRLIPTLS